MNLTQAFQELSREEIKDFLDDVNTSAKSLYELLENLLLWSRSQRGLIPYHPINLDTNSMIASNMELLKFRISGISSMIDIIPQLAARIE